MQLPCACLFPGEGIVRLRLPSKGAGPSALGFSGGDSMGDILLGQSHHPWEQGGTSITKLMVLHVHCAAVSHKLSLSGS